MKWTYFVKHNHVGLPIDRHLDSAWNFLEAKRIKCFRDPTFEIEEVYGKIENRVWNQCSATIVGKSTAACLCSADFGNIHNQNFKADIL